ncbi:MAG: diguanylate cyclase [Actinomycetota bacterium]|nr:diguanylate cyclase [Actinomycetota bacterium]
MEIMEANRQGASRVRVPIAWKFFLLLGVVVPSVLAVSWVGVHALTSMKERLDAVYEDSLNSTRTVGQLSTAIRDAEETSRLLVADTQSSSIETTTAELRDKVMPTVQRKIDLLRVLAARDSTGEDLALAEQLQSEWQRFLAYTQSQTFLAAASGPSKSDSGVSIRVEGLARSLGSLVGQIDATEAEQANNARDEAQATFASSLFLLRVFVIVGLSAGVTATLWLTRDVVRRVRAYSSFAARVAAGDLESRTDPRGHDELTDLGKTLNRMVTQRASARDYEVTQAEFTDALQMTETEEEAHGLLKHHLERSILGASAVTLNRNNSADRLEAFTAPPPGPLAGNLVEARPRDCLAVRLARTHVDQTGSTALVRCSLCGEMEGFSACTPLLVSGEVIGSVFVNGQQVIHDGDIGRIKDSVSQAAPVLANLRNLAIAELRAATDALTGLPNTRAVQDVINRLVAQASRMVWPLTAVLFDLDHFKQINDTFGHPKGDEVLAAVGATLLSVMRESDFVGRYGGEEFVMLLPAADLETGLQVAERVRAAIADIQIFEENRSITASFGVAVFPDHASDAARLIRSADRALYQAKAKGRNRVEVFSMDSQADESQSVLQDEPA